jgi:hypothetical protein
VSRIRAFISSRPVLAVVLTAVLALVLGAGAGAAGPTGEVSELEDQAASLEADLKATEADLEAANDATDEATADAAAARDALKPLQAQADEVEEQKDDLAAQEEELAAQAGELDAREQDITARENTLESSTIPDGIWELGRDYEAGTYRAEGGGGCYWEKLSSPTGKLGDIIANGGFQPNQTLVIDSPYFSTSDCGEWVKIG